MIETTRGVAERLVRAGARVEERAPFAFDAMRTAWGAYMRCVGATPCETQ